MLGIKHSKIPSDSCVTVFKRIVWTFQVYYGSVILWVICYFAVFMLIKGIFQYLLVLLVL